LAAEPARFGGRYLLLSLVIVVVTAVATILLLGERVGQRRSPVHLTPQRYQQLQLGLTVQAVRGFKPVSPQVTESSEEPSGENCRVLEWREYGLASTYGTYVAWRLTFVAGVLKAKSVSEGP
jgi:hypothetical protein